MHRIKYIEQNIVALDYKPPKFICRLPLRSKSMNKNTYSPMPDKMSTNSVFQLDTEIYVHQRVSKRVNNFYIRQKLSHLEKRKTNSSAIYDRLDECQNNRIFLPNLKYLSCYKKRISGSIFYNTQQLK